MRSFVAGMGIVLGLALAARAEEQPTKQSVRFDGQKLELAYEAQGDEASIKEFIPQGQQLDNWTALAAIREQSGVDDPMEAVSNVVRKLKEDSPQSPFKVIQNEKTGEVIVDFVIWPADGSFVEFNVFKYSKRDSGGIVSQQYALREYKDTEEFLKGLRPVRERLVELMADKGLEPGAATQVKTATRPAEAQEEAIGEHPGRAPGIAEESIGE